MENVPKTEQRIWKIFVIWIKTEEIKGRGKKINKWVDSVWSCKTDKQAPGHSLRTQEYVTSAYYMKYAYSDTAVQGYYKSTSFNLLFQGQ